MTDGRSTPVDAERRTREAITRITAWMNAHEAPLLVENLAAGATDDVLAAAERGLGTTLPDDLRALWLLHDGQREEGNGFFEMYDFLSANAAVGQQESVLLCVGFEREHPEQWEETGGTLDELRSDAWVPFAGRDSDSLAVHGLTGRVFECPHDDAPTLVAGSLLEWLEGYASRVAADDYAVEEGFGDYHLSLRDRAAERRAEEEADRDAAYARFRKETPLLDQLKTALVGGKEGLCTEVLEEALGQSDPAAWQACVGLLFAGTERPAFAAGALRPLLRRIELAPDHWVDVAVGGAQLGNRAVTDVAVARSGGASVARLARLASEVKGASAADRSALEAVLEGVRTKASAETRAAADAASGSWFSRLFRRTPKG